MLFKKETGQDRADLRPAQRSFSISLLFRTLPAHTTLPSTIRAGVLMIPREAITGEIGNVFDLRLSASVPDGLAHILKKAFALCASSAEHLDIHS